MSMKFTPAASILTSAWPGPGAGTRIAFILASFTLKHMKTSFIGLGSMGLPMARHLLQAGHTLTVYNRTRARADQLQQFNPVVADSPAAAVRDAEVLVTMVADDAALEDVMLGPDGALAAL